MKLEHSYIDSTQDFFASV